MRLNQKIWLELVDLPDWLIDCNQNSESARSWKFINTSHDEVWLNKTNNNLVLNFWFILFDDFWVYA